MQTQPSSKAHDGFYHKASLLQTIALLPRAATTIRIGFDARCATIYAVYRGVQIQVSTTPTRAWGHILVRVTFTDLDWLYAQLVRPPTPGVFLHVRHHQLVVAATQQLSPLYGLTR